MFKVNERAVLFTHIGPEFVWINDIEEDKGSIRFREEPGPITTPFWKEGDNWYCEEYGEKGLLIIDNPKLTKTIEDQQRIGKITSAAVSIKELVEMLGTHFTDEDLNELTQLRDKFLFNLSQRLSS